MNRYEFAKNLLDSIESARIDMDLTQAEMAAKLDMPLSSYKRMINSPYSKIDFYVCYRMYELTGKPMYAQIGYDDNMVSLIQLVHRLPSSSRDHIKGILESELALSSSHSDHSIIPLLVPSGDMFDGMVFDSCDIQSFDAGSYTSVFRSDLHCAIKVTSNHLHPVYSYGDILLVCQRPPRHGDTGIFINNETHRAYLRKFYQSNPCLLKPVNDYGHTFKVNPLDKSDMNQWTKFGYVLTVYR